MDQALTNKLEEQTYAPESINKGNRSPEPPSSNIKGHLEATVNTATVPAPAILIDANGKSRARNCQRFGAFLIVTGYLLFAVLFYVFTENTVQLIGLPFLALCLLGWCLYNPHRRPDEPDILDRLCFDPSFFPAKREVDERDRLKRHAEYGNHSTGHRSFGNHSPGHHSYGNHSPGHHSFGNHSTGHHSIGNHSTGHHSFGNHSFGHHSFGGGGGGGGGGWSSDS